MVASGRRSSYSLRGAVAHSRAPNAALQVQRKREHRERAALSTATRHATRGIPAPKKPRSSPSPIPNGCKMTTPRSRAETGTIAGAFEPELQPGFCSRVISALVATRGDAVLTPFRMLRPSLGAGWNVSPNLSAPRAAKFAHLANGAGGFVLLTTTPALRSSPNSAQFPRDSAQPCVLQGFLGSAG
jgi:hypothetical protein